MKIHERDIPPGTKIDPSWEIIEDEPEELERSKEPCKSADSDLSILNKYKRRQNRPRRCRGIYESG